MDDNNHKETNGIHTRKNNDNELSKLLEILQMNHNSQPTSQEHLNIDHTIKENKENKIERKP